MFLRGLLVRASIGVLLVLAGALVVVGGVAVRGAGLVGVLVTALVAACVAAGVARESVPAGASARPAAVEAAWRTGAWTVGGLLAVCGASAIAGAGAGVLVVLLGGGAWLARWLLRRRAAAVPAADVVPLFGRDGEGRDAGGAAAEWPAGLSVAELGRAWVRSSAALAATGDPAARERLVARRQQALDELERRDPEGFARWLADGATIDSDPAGWVTQPPTTGTEAA